VGGDGSDVRLNVEARGGVEMVETAALVHRHVQQSSYDMQGRSAEYLKSTSKYNINRRERKSILRGIIISTPYAKLQKNHPNIPQPINRQHPSEYKTPSETLIAINLGVYIKHADLKHASRLVVANALPSPCCDQSSHHSSHLLALPHQE
jgi:hypothetical protein